MVDVLLGEVTTLLTDFFRLPGPAGLFKCTAGDVSIHDKNNDGGNEEEISESIILSLVSIEEENVLKNNYPVRRSGSTIIQEKSAVYINVYLLFAAKYANYDTALKAISQVIYCFQANKRLMLTTATGDDQECILQLFNMGFENLNNLWTVLGGRYLPSVVYKARVLMYQQAPPLAGRAIISIQENASV